MKNFASFAIAAVAAVANAEQIFDIATDANLDNQTEEVSKQVYTTWTGAVVEEISPFHQSVTFPEKPFKHNQAVRAEHLKEMTQIIKQRKEANAISNEYDRKPQWNCGTRMVEQDPTGALNLLPIFYGNLSPSNFLNLTEGTGTCFRNIGAQLFSTGDYSFYILLTLDFKHGFLCSERFLFGNTEIAHLENYRNEGTYRVDFELRSEEAKKDFDVNGINIWQFCNGAKDEL